MREIYQRVENFFTLSIGNITINAVFLQKN